jgi:hypothetical protein
MFQQYRDLEADSDDEDEPLTEEQEVAALQRAWIEDLAECTPEDEPAEDAEVGTTADLVAACRLGRMKVVESRD